MTPDTYLRVSRWSAAGSVLLIVGAMSLYPGGNSLDPQAARYAFSRNFLSDLGMTVTFGGRPNILGAYVFGVGFLLLAISIIACTTSYLAFHLSSPTARPAAITGGAFALLAAVGLLGAGVSPADRDIAMHMAFVSLALTTGPIALCLFSVAAARDARVPRRAALAWLILATAVGGLFAIRWGPDVSTTSGLTVHVLTQKVVATIVVAVLLFQSRPGALGRDGH